MPLVVKVQLVSYQQSFYGPCSHARPSDGGYKIQAIRLKLLLFSCSSFELANKLPPHPFSLIDFLSPAQKGKVKEKQRQYKLFAGE